MKWIVFCSQTGSEIKKLSNIIGIYPDLLVTNDIGKLMIRDWLLSKKIPILSLPNKPILSDYDFLSDYDLDSLITLHGYLRIMPNEIVLKYKIYNGHPGLINHNPDLKGLDPQKKAFKNKYRKIGSVIHIVDEGVDSGDVICSYAVNSIKRESSLDDYFEVLSYCSLQCWVEFFNNKLYKL